MSVSSTTKSPGLRAIEAELEREQRHLRVAVAAYFRAQRRGFKAGHEEEDWLEAEREINGPANEHPGSWKVTRR